MGKGESLEEGEETLRNDRLEGGRLAEDLRCESKKALGP